MKAFLKIFALGAVLGLCACSDDDEKMSVQDMTKWEDVDAKQLKLTVNGERMEDANVRFLEDGTSGKVVKMRFYLGFRDWITDIDVTAKPLGDGLELSGESKVDGVYEMKLKGFFTDKPLSASFVHEPKMNVEIEYRVTSPLGGSTYEIDMAKQPVNVANHYEGECVIDGKKMAVSEALAHAQDCINSELAAKNSKVRMEFSTDGIKTTYVQAAGSDEFVQAWKGRYYMNDECTATVRLNSKADKYVIDVWMSTPGGKGDVYCPLDDVIVFKIDPLDGDKSQLTLVPYTQLEVADSYCYVKEKTGGWSKFDLGCLTQMMDSMKAEFKQNNKSLLWSINCSRQ